MIIAVASGKGGTGKTTVAVNLALASVSQRPVFLDCDVEEPNAALFFHPAIEERRRVGQQIPHVDLGRCTFCGRCAEVCQYNAIAVVGEEVMVFPQLCHGCGSCSLNCPVEAIREETHPMGIIERGTAAEGALTFAQGTMNVGEAMAVPIISALKRWVVPAETDGRLVILDSPPGNACPVVETMRGADFVLLVTEPTPFGLHDLRVAVEVARDELGLPVGVVINRDGVGDEGVEAYCEAEDVPILMRIPQDRRIAEVYAEGATIVEALPEYRKRFGTLYRAIEKGVGS